MYQDQFITLYISILSYHHTYLFIFFSVYTVYSVFDLILETEIDSFNQLKLINIVMINRLFMSITKNKNKQSPKQLKLKLGLVWLLGETSMEDDIRCIQIGHNQNKYTHNINKYPLYSKQSHIILTTFI